LRKKKNLRWIGKVEALAERSNSPGAPNMGRIRIQFN
jgi:hypothetical protein